MRIIVSLFIATILSGCTTASGDYFNSDYHLVDDLNGYAQVVFYRYKQFAGSADETTLVDNGNRIGTIVNGGFLVYRTDPGSHTLHTDTAGIDKAAQITMEAGKTYYLRADFQPSWIGFWRISGILPEQAKQELKAVRAMHLRNQAANPGAKTR